MTSCINASAITKTNRVMFTLDACQPHKGAIYTDRCLNQNKTLINKTHIKEQTNKNTHKKQKLLKRRNFYSVFTEMLDRKRCSTHARPGVAL